MGRTRKESTSLQDPNSTLMNMNLTYVLISILITEGSSQEMDATDFYLANHIKTGVGREIHKL